MCYLFFDSYTIMNADGSWTEVYAKVYIKPRSLMILNLSIFVEAYTTLAVEMEINPLFTCSFQSRKNDSY